jgi:acetolactate synthase I/II/III large subunit
MTCKDKISTIRELLRGASRPLFVWGAGMRPYANSSLALARSLGVPVACTWSAIDLIHHYDPLNCGGFGTHGTRAANLAIQNSDAIIGLGCRFDTKATGTPTDFAPKAKLCMVDIDHAEISKFEKLGRKIDIGLCMDAGEFIAELSVQFPTEHMTLDFAEWRTQIICWKEKYVPQGPAYDLMRQIGDYTNPDDIIVSDTGNTLGWIMQGFPFKGERFIHAFNFTPMGFGFAASIGAAFSFPDHRVCCISGDGGALMTVNELATIARNDLNIKIILLDNGCHAMCKHTQRQWLGGKYYATSPEGGLSMPVDWEYVSIGMGVVPVRTLDELFCAGNYPRFMRVRIDPDESLAFQVKYGEALA